jgi:hypothetical protein
MDTNPPPTTVDADWVQSPDEQPRNSWTWPWPPADEPMPRRSDDGQPRAELTPRERDEPPKGIRHKTDDLVSRSILASVRDDGSFKPVVWMSALVALAVAALTASIRHRTPDR